MRHHHARGFTALLALLLSASLHAQGWLELPASASDPGNTLVSTQTMRQGRRDIRSHTYRYSPQHRISLWVAYPLNAGLIGTGSRGDGWHPYGGIPSGLQPVLRKGFAYGSGYDRGHQIPSADRLDRDANDATFTYVNATPQRHDFNGGLWADLEKLVRTWAKRSDTLYVVTGALPGKTTIADNDGNPVNIPLAYWKAVLRRNTDRAGRTRWSMCAVCIAHSNNRPADLTWPQTLDYLSTFALPVTELERITGESLFHNLAGVTGEYTCRELKEKDPRDEPWWWK